MSPRARRPMLIDPYRPFIEEALATYPTLRASRLYQMCRERGYAGRPDHFRHVIATLRPRPHREAYLRLNRLPGEEGQVDFAHFGKMRIGNRTWPLIALVVVLSWSRPHLPAVHAKHEAAVVPSRTSRGVRRVRAARRVG